MARNRHHRRQTLLRILGFFGAGGAPAAGPTNLREQFFATDDLATAKQLFDTRFGVDTREPDDAPKQLTVRALRKAWKYLEALPESHARDNPSFQQFQRTTRTDIGGEYASGKIIIRYRDWLIDLYRAMKGANWSDPLFFTKHFKRTLYHEIGHALDDEHGYRGFLNPAGWLSERETDIIGIFAAQHYQTPAERQNVVELLTFLAQGIGKDKAEMRTSLMHGLGQLVGGASYDSAVRARAAAENLGLIVNGQIDAAAVEAFLGTPLMRTFFASTDAWKHDDGGASLGLLIDGRIYQRTQGAWYSYLAADRAYKVSKYAYRAPGEWFAEHYAAYYDPSSRDAFREKDPVVYAFFTNVLEGVMDPYQVDHR